MQRVRYCCLSWRRFARMGRRARIRAFSHCTPYLDVLADEGRNVMAMMPARQGVVHWPAKGNSASALVDEACLPLADGKAWTSCWWCMGWN